jgi:hypothetical protein
MAAKSSLPQIEHIDIDTLGIDLISRVEAPSPLIPLPFATRKNTLRWEYNSASLQ